MKALIKLVLAAIMLSACNLTWCQTISSDKKHVIDSVISDIVISGLVIDENDDRNFFIVETLINDLDGEPKEGINELWLLNRKISISEMKGEMEKSIALKIDYIKVQSLFYQSTENLVSLNYQDSIEYQKEHYHASRYYEEVAEYLVQDAEYEKALQYLEIQRSIYPSLIKVDYLMRSLNNHLLSSKIYFELGNYDRVISLLLPYSFEGSYFCIQEKQKEEIDSMLYFSLEKNYSHGEILDELNSCIEHTISEYDTIKNQHYSFMMFEREVLIPKPIAKFRAKRRKRGNTEEMESVNRSSRIDRYRLGILCMIKNMRLYKYVDNE